MSTISVVPENLIQDRIIRLLIFILINFIALRYLSEVNLTDYDQAKIVAISTICFMFISTYYPYVIAK